jgi:hypothetical protein
MVWGDVKRLKAAVHPSGVWRGDASIMNEQTVLFDVLYKRVQSW